MTSVALLLRRLLLTDQGCAAETTRRALSEQENPQFRAVAPVPYRDAEPWFEQPHAG